MRPSLARCYSHLTPFACPKQITEKWKTAIKEKKRLSRKVCKCESEGKTKNGKVERQVGQEGKTSL